MADDVLGHLRPLPVVLGGIDVVLFERLVLNALAQAVEHFHTGVLDALYIAVREREIVRLGFVGVLGEIRENDGHIHHMLSVGAISGGIMVPGIAHVGSPEKAGRAGIYLFGIIDSGAVVHGIHTLDGAHGCVGRYGDLGPEATTCAQQCQGESECFFHLISGEHFVHV